MLVERQLSGTEIRNFLSKVTFPFDRQEGAKIYHEVHCGRYAITLNAIAKMNFNTEISVLELAANPYGMSAYLANKLRDNLVLASYSEINTCKDVVILIDDQEFSLKEHGFNVEQDVWPLPQESFDFVLACEIVEHLAMDPMALFAGANRVLKPGGYFFVSTPNAASIQNFIKLGRLMPAGLASQFRRPFSLARLYERHNREYSPFTIGQMFLSAGFEIVIMETDSAFPVFDMGYSQDQIQAMIDIIGMPELRRDTINVIGRKIGDIVERYPVEHDLYVAEDG